MFTCLGGQNNLDDPESGLRIEIEGSPSFNPGQTIIGQVVLTNNNPKELKCILIRFLGKAKVHWLVKKYQGRGSYTKHYAAEDIYFADEKLLVGNETDSITLPPGRHSYPFAYNLPPRIPCSVSHSLGKVVYSIETVMKRTWYKRDQIKSLPFKVQAHLNLNNLPALSAPAKAQRDKYLCSCIPCKMGYLSFHLRVTKRGFVPGENITFRAQIDNGTGYELRPPKVQLVQVINFYAEGKTKTETCVIVKVKGDRRTGPGKILEWADQGTLKVPQVPPDGLGGCKIIDVLYVLKLELKLPMFWKNASCEIPLVIGTVPLTTGDFGNANTGFATQVHPQTVADNQNQNWQYFDSPQSEGYRDSLNPSGFNRAYLSTNESHTLVLNPDYGPFTYNADNDNDDNETLPPPYEDAIQMQKFP